MMIKKLIHKFWCIIYKFRYGEHSKIYRIHKVLKPLFDEKRIRMPSTDELEKQLKSFGYSPEVFEGIEIDPHKIKKSKIPFDWRLKLFRKFGS